MQLTEAILGADRFRVEVSGWDEEEVFFVEKSHLDWDEFAGKHIALHHMLPEGALVFVRMLQPTALRQAPPMAYKVEFIGCDPEGLHQFRLSVVQPRYNPEVQPVNSEPFPSRSAQWPDLELSASSHLSSFPKNLFSRCMPLFSLVQLSS